MAMTYDKLLELAQAKDAAALHYMNLGMRNTYGLDASERVRLDLDYDLAFRALGRATAAYEKGRSEYLERTEVAIPARDVASSVDGDAKNPQEA